jgi:uncharacterized protein YbaP (TraB family)
MMTRFQRKRFAGLRFPLKHLLLIGWLALAGLVASAGARADTAPVCAGRDLTEDVDLKSALDRRADDLVNSRGLLWRIEKAGVAPSYLYGTMHSSDSDAVALAHEAAKMLDGANVIVTELRGPLTAVDKAEMAGQMLAQALDRDVDTFAGALTAEAGQRVDSLLAERGLPHEFAHHLKLWFLAVVTSLPQCETQRAQMKLPVVDDILADAARQRGLTDVALETPLEQINALASLPPDAAAALLAQNARDPARIDDGFVTMLRLYREKRPAEVLAVLDALPGLTTDERSAQEKFLELMVARNAAMAERAKPLLDVGGAFIAVGALHLPGKQGLIERWRAQGYTVVNVW